MAMPHRCEVVQVVFLCSSYKTCAFGVCPAFKASMRSKQCAPHQSEGVLPSFALRLKLRFALKAKKQRGNGARAERGHSAWQSCWVNLYGGMLDELQEKEPENQS